MKCTRRDFNRLTASAFSGMLAGTVIGCGGDDNEVDEPVPGTGGAASTDSGSDGTAPADDGRLIGGERPEYNLCLGLNQCKDYGKNPGEHDCAGQGACATVQHDCMGMNACKYLGACDGKVYANDCKGQGGCQLPLVPGDDLWQQARAAFEKRMQAQGKELGPAPLQSTET